MSRESLVMLLGLIVLFAPSLGIPSEWKAYVLPISGGLLLLLGYSLRRSMYLRTLEKGNGERGNDAFLEHQGNRRGEIREDETSSL